MAFRGFVSSRPAIKRVIIPADDFYIRRIRWIYKRTLKGTGVEIRVVALQPEDYTRTNWWRSERGLIELQSEVAKDIYYHLKY